MRLQVFGMSPLSIDRIGGRLRLTGLVVVVVLAASLLASVPTQAWADPTVPPV